MTFFFKAFLGWKFCGAFGALNRRQSEVE